MDRRTFLATSGVGLATPLVGCLGGSSDPDGTGDDTRTETETTTDRGTETGETELVEYETIQYAPTSTRPNWFEETDETVGNVVVIDSEERADAVLARDALATDRREEVTDFLQNTDFGESVLLYVESVGPNACNDEIEVEELAFESGKLSGTASVVDTSEGMTVCAETITYPSALVRATFSGAPVTQATIRLIDGWDNETEVTATADDPLSPDSADLDGYVRSEGDPAHVPDSLACDDEAVTVAFDVTE